MSFETSDNLPKYFRSIAKLKPLSVEEERALAVHIQAGDQLAIHALVRHNLRIVITIANRHIGQGVAIDDLIQEGNLGLYEAAQRFDPKSDARFISYAQLWVRKRINEAVVAYGRIVRLPHNQEYDIYKAKIAGEEVHEISTVQIDAPIGEEGDSTIGDVILFEAPAAMLQADLDHTKHKVKAMLSLLKLRDREIICAYFGIDREYAMPTDIIADRYQMTNVRVCQIVKGAITKMKEVT